MKLLIKIGIGLIFLFAVYLVSNDIEIERENNQHINKNIYEAFEKIEQHCMSYKYMDMPKKCELVLQLEEECSDVRRECSAEKYYEALHRVGFDLPPFYELGYNKKYPIWKFWKK